MIFSYASSKDDVAGLDSVSWTGQWDVGQDQLARVPNLVPEEHNTADQDTDLTRFLVLNPKSYGLQM